MELLPEKKYTLTDQFKKNGLIIIGKVKGVNRKRKVARIEILKLLYKKKSNSVMEKNYYDPMLKKKITKKILLEETKEYEFSLFNGMYRRAPKDGHFMYSLDGAIKMNDLVDGDIVIVVENLSKKNYYELAQFVGGEELSIIP